MKILCNREELVEAVSNVSRAIPSKSSFTALEGVLIKTGEGSVSLTGYNLELGIKTSIKAGVQGDGAVLLSAHLFGEIIKKLPNPDITIEADESLNVLIKSGDSEFSIMSGNPEEFPELPILTESNSITISQPLLKSMIRQTKFAIAVDDSKPIHKGVLFETGENQLRLVAVDGFRLAVRKEAIEVKDDLSFVVPGKTLSEIQNLLSDSDEEVIEIFVGKKQIFFNIGSYNVISRLLEGTFLDYKSAIPTKNATELKIDTKILLNCFERASLVIVERLKSPVRCIFDEDLIKVSCSTTLGKSFEQVEAKIEGEPLEIGFNNRFLLDALRASETDMVRLALNGANAPMKILPPEGDSFLFLVLPVRIKQEF